jgi:hypothetical protein
MPLKLAPVRRRYLTSRRVVPVAVLLCVAVAAVVALRWSWQPPDSGTGIVTADGHGWTESGLGGPPPAPGSCRYRTAGNGQLLPDPRCTPGAVDPAVTERTLGRTICRPGGYTSSVRPPEQLTEDAKFALLSAYGVDGADADRYELDHLIPLSAGGASDLRNLWPEPNVNRQYPATAFVHNDKDAVEAYTFTALCDHDAGVSAVQRAMATDWTTAVATLGLTPIPSGYRG